MQKVADTMPASLDQVLHHLHRALELLRDVKLEQQGTEKHILEILAILDVDTDASVDRLTGLIREMRGETAA